MKKLISLLLALVLVLGLVACGGGAKGAQGVTKDTVTIANSAATSGALAAVGLPFLAGINGYLDMVNSEGGIDGRQVKFIHQDDEFDPVKGQAALEKFVEDEKVFAIVGHFGTPVVGATLQSLKEYGIPAVYFATGIGQLFSAKATTNEEGYNIFPIQPLYITEGQLMVARGVGTFGAKKIGMIYTNDDAGKNMLQGAEDQAKTLNVELVAEQVAVGAADVSAAVTKVLSAGVDFVIVGAIQATMPTIVKELASQGNKAPGITTYVNAAVTISQQIAGEIEGKFDMYVSSWKIRDDAHKSDVDLFMKWVDPEHTDNADAESGWIAAHVFCEGLRRLKGQDVTWASYMKALESAPITIPFGGTISFADGARTGVSSMQLSKCNMNDPSGTGWELVYGFATMDEIINGK